MKALSALKEGVIYRDIPISLLINNEKDNLHGNLLFFLSTNNFDQTHEFVSFKEIKDVINGSRDGLKTFKNIWHPYRIDLTPVVNKRMMFNLAKYKDEVKEQLPTFRTLFKKIDSYRGKNLVVDLTPTMTFFNYNTNFKGVKRILGYRQILNNMMFDPIFDSYKSRIVVIPMDFTLKDFTDTYTKIMSTTGSLDNVNFPIAHVNRMMKEEKLVGGKNPYRTYYIFYNVSMGQFFYINSNDPIDYQKFKSKIGYFIKTNHGKVSQLSTDELKAGAKIDGMEDASSVLKPIKDAVEGSNRAVKVSAHFNDIIHRIISGDKSSANAVDVIKDPKISEHVEKIEEIVASASASGSEVDADEIIDQLSNDEEIRKELNEILNKSHTMTDVGKELLKKAKDKQDKVALPGNTTIDGILKKAKEKSIETEMMNTPDLLDTKLRSSTLRDFEKSYNEKRLLDDYYRIFLYFNRDEENPLFIKKFDVQNSYDGMSFKHLYRVMYTDKSNKSHTIAVDIPDVVDNRFIIINNSKKVILKQLTALPLSKTDPDEVFLTTNYNKFQIVRVGKKYNEYIERFKKLMMTEPDFLKSSKVSFNKEDLIVSDSELDGTIEYNGLAEIFVDITFPNLSFMFRKEQLEEATSKKTKYAGEDASLFKLVGYGKGDILYYIKQDDSKVYMSSGGKKPLWVSDSMVEFALTQMPNSYPVFLSKGVGKKFMYSAVNILNRRVPLVILLGFYTGLYQLLNNYGVEHDIVIGKKKFASEEESLKWRLIPFADTKLYYRNTPENNLLLNGLIEMQTKNYKFSEFSEMEAYLEYFEENLNATRNIAKGFKNTLNRMIDPITEEVLEDLGLPLDISNVILEANSMLADNKFFDKNDPSSYRIRGTESIASYLYKILADQFNRYISTSDPFSIPRDRLIKALLESKITEDYSTLNPMFEIEQSTKATMKGNSGLNSDHAYTSKVRAYHANMQGLFGNYVTTSGEAGVQKFLTYNPKLKGVRGYIDANKKDLHSTELFSANELVSSFTMRNSDPPRQSMTTKQSSHLVPTNHQDAPMVGSGVEKTLPFLMSRDFIFVALQDGKVLDSGDGFLIIQYKDGTNDIINLSNQISKNASSGFYTSNVLTPLVKPGGTFKKDDILAKNDTFFKGDKKEVLFSTGTLAKVAMIPKGDTLEDSSLITDVFSEKLYSPIIMKEIMVFSTTTNIEKMVKVGEEVKTGQNLVKFETIPDDQSGIDLLSGIGDEFQNAITDLAKNTKRSRYSGKVVDIRIYYNREISEFTPSLQKLINDYIRTVKSAKKRIDSLNLAQPPNIILPSVDLIKSDRILNTTVSGILIELYIQHDNRNDVGSKITLESASKTVVSKIIPRGEEPFSEFRPDEPIDVIFSPLSVVSRMTMDIMSLMFAHKVLKELKRTVQKIYEE